MDPLLFDTAEVDSPLKHAGVKQGCGPFARLITRTKLFENPTYHPIPGSAPLAGPWKTRPPNTRMALLPPNAYTMQ